MDRSLIPWSPQIPSESEGTALLPIPGPLRFLWNLRGRPFFRFACFSPSHRWLGKKNLRHAPANPFMRFARRAVNRKERQDFIPSAPQGQRNKTRESERFFPSHFMARFSHGIFDSGEKSRRKTRGGKKNVRGPAFFYPIPALPNSPKARPRPSIRWGPYCMQFILVPSKSHAILGGPGGTKVRFAWRAV